LERAGVVCGDWRSRGQPHEPVVAGGIVLTWAKRRSASNARQDPMRSWITCSAAVKRLDNAATVLDRGETARPLDKEELSSNHPGIARSRGRSPPSEIVNQRLVLQDAVKPHQG